MRITAEQLREKGACEDQVHIFEKEWGKGGEVTLPNLLRAVELGINLDWFATNFLPAPIRARCVAEVAPIWARCDAEVDPISARYKAEIDPIRARYKAEVAPIWARYNAEVALIIAKFISKEG